MFSAYVVAIHPMIKITGVLAPFIKIVSEKKVDKDALLKEKELLLQRLDEIEELLKYN